MMIPFHIDQINEILKYLDDVPHRFSRGLVDYFKNHVENHVKTTEAEVQKGISEINQDIEEVKTEIVDLIQK
jgi:hypothetical protein